MNQTMSTEESLRAEIESLKRQLGEQKKAAGSGTAAHPAGPSRATLTILALLHLFVMPLDVLWFAALRRFGIE